MAVHVSKHMVHLLYVAILIASTKTQPTSKPNCPTKCGNVTIPFPFGTTQACSLNTSFLITCNTTLSPPTPFLNNNNNPVRVLGISLDGELNTSLPVASDCVNKSTGESISSNIIDIDLTPFHLSFNRNKLTVVGANTAGVLYSEPNQSNPSACVSLYNNAEGPTSSCSGVYCCQTEIPRMLSNFTYISVANVFNTNSTNTDQFDAYPCGYAFLVENESFQFSNFVTKNHINLNNNTMFPAVVHWAVGYHTCQHAKKNGSSYVCKSDHSECHDPNGGQGYLCNCSTGFHGNPYLQDGCIDVDECSAKSHDCCEEAKCKNTNGSYSCHCPKGYEGDGKKNGTKCTRKGRNHSECHDPNGGQGYLCNCSTGFHGNPYLQDGCIDVDECSAKSHDCCEEANCKNTNGSYSCHCPKGYEGDGKKNGTKCTRKGRSDIMIVITLSVSATILTLVGGTFYVYYTLKKRKFIKLKAHFFQQNGGLFLQQQMAKYNGSTKMTEVFTIEELKEATNNFDKSMIIGQGGQGTVYKGIFPDNKIVAIKKSKINNSNQVEHFINEVIMLSQINHRNVVKLLGCCLETEVPLLVYEFIPNGTVYDHLHDQSQTLRLTWKTRLRIATETAQALAYLHCATSTPIIHRDVKTVNILLDHNLVAKVADFGASRTIPLDQSQVTTLVQGTLGYLDPEYFRTSQLTEKSDVYSFGVVLIELVTGKKALCFDGPEDHRNLAMYFDSSMKEGQLINIVDRHIIDEASIEQLMKVANIARHCLRLKGEERPTMREVAMQLEGICGVDKHQWENTNLSSAETKDVLDATQYAVDVAVGDGGRGNTSSSFDILNQISMSLNNGR